jgi:hypothetical protein
MKTWQISGDWMIDWTWKKRNIECHHHENHWSDSNGWQSSTSAEEINSPGTMKKRLSLSHAQVFNGWDCWEWWL